jgi:hypothetical protein
MAAAAVIGLGTTAHAAAPASPYAPLAYLVGHCWQGTFPDGKVTDTHCFSWIYGGKFIRDQHVVHHGAGSKDDLGESIYLWDAASGELQYLYIESAGGFSRGSVTAAPDALVFPPTHYSENGQQQTYRSRWKRSDDTAYDVVTEFLVRDQWQPGFTVHMKAVKSGGGS